MPGKGRVPAAGTYVPPYTKSDGTRVNGYYRGAPSGGGVAPTAAQAQAARAVKRGGPVGKQKD